MHACIFCLPKPSADQKEGEKIATAAHAAGVHFSKNEPTFQRICNTALK
jgi:hypothetical protein